MLEHLRRPKTASPSIAASPEGTEGNYKGLSPGTWGLRDQLSAILFQVVQSGGGGLGTCVVVVGQNAVGAGIWTACTTSLKNLEQANVDERNSDHMNGFGEKDRDIYLEVPLGLLNITGGLSPGKSQTEACCLVSGSYWYTKVSLPLTMFQTRSDVPPSNFRCMWTHLPILPLLCSSTSWWGTQWVQRFYKPRWWRLRILFKLPCEIIELSFTSFSVSRGSSLIRHVTPWPRFFASTVHELATTVTVFKRRSAEREIPCTTCEL